MVLAAAEAGTGDDRQIDATVNLVTDLDQFEQRVEAEITDDGSHVDVDPATVRDRRCETTNGELVDPRQVVAAAFSGRIRLIVGIVAASRNRQLFTGALREAIMAIDPVCGWLGCNLRAQICAIDHLEPKPAADPPTPGTPRSCATTATSSNTPPGTTSNAPPTATSTSRDPTAPPSRYPTQPEVSLRRSLRS
jgi:hypothetical protein